MRYIRKVYHIGAPAAKKYYNNHIQKNSPWSCIYVQ